MTDLPGDAVALLATAYFLAFGALLIATGVAARRHENAPPRDAERRVRLAYIVSALHLGRALWFAVLFVIASATVVAVSPKIPLLDIIVVYGGLIALLHAASSATEWFLTARKTRAAARRLAQIVVAGTEIYDDLVEIRVSRDTLARLTAGDRLTGDEIEVLRIVNGKAFT